MRCRVGDLAVVVGNRPGAALNEGRLVEVLRKFQDGGAPAPSWWVRGIGRELSAPWGSVWEVGCCDDCLRPLRDNDGEDEMLRIARLNDQDKANALRHAMQKHRERLVEEAPKQ